MHGVFLVCNITRANLTYVMPSQEIIYDKKAGCGCGCGCTL